MRLRRGGCRVTAPFAPCDDRSAGGSAAGHENRRAGGATSLLQKPRILPRHRLVQHFVDALEDGLAIGLRPVIAIRSVGGAVLLGRNGARFGVEPVVAAVALE